MIVGVVAGGDHLRQDGNGIGYGPAVDAAVQVTVSAGDFHLYIGEAPDPDVDGGGVHAEHGRIADEDDIRL